MVLITCWRKFWIAMSRLLRAMRIVAEFTSKPKFFSNGCDTDNAAVPVYTKLLPITGVNRVSDAVKP